MSKRKTGWKEFNHARDNRKRPLEESELRGVERLEPWDEMGEEAYEQSIIDKLLHAGESLDG